MSKAILIFDRMPKSCRGCPICAYKPGSEKEKDEYYCPYGVPNQGAFNIVVSSRLDADRPEWCPLRYPPEYYRNEEKYGGDPYMNGWNDCLRELDLLNWRPKWPPEKEGTQHEEELGDE